MDILDNEAAFYWWRWHIGDDQAEQIPDQEPGARGATIFTIDGNTYKGPGQVIGGGVPHVN